MSSSSAVVSKLLPLMLTPATRQHTASLILLHGSGDTGEGIHSWLKMLLGAELAFPHIKIIYPTAPVRRYTPNNGSPSTVWFDRLQISPYVREDTVSIDEVCKDLDQLVDNEVNQGIPRNRIMVGGNSMGAAMALHYGYGRPSKAPGIFALSGFLNQNSVVYEAIRSGGGARVYPRLYQAHGDDDDLVNIEWGTETNKKLKELGVDAEFHVYHGMGHEMCKKELVELKNWITSVCPEEDPAL